MQSTSLMHSPEADVKPDSTSPPLPWTIDPSSPLDASGLRAQIGRLINEEELEYLHPLSDVFDTFTAAGQSLLDSWEDGRLESDDDLTGFADHHALALEDLARMERKLPAMLAQMTTARTVLEGLPHVLPLPQPEAEDEAPAPTAAELRRALKAMARAGTADANALDEMLETLAGVSADVLAYADEGDLEKAARYLTSLREVAPRTRDAVIRLAMDLCAAVQTLEASSADLLPSVAEPGQRAAAGRASA